jgi:5-methylcytosine-specific restriction endonuclease McrA
VSIDEETRRKRAAYMRAYNALNNQRVNEQRRKKRAEGSYSKRERDWRKANRDKVLAYKKRDREKNRESYRQAKRAWKQRHKERLKEKSRLAYALHKDEIRASCLRARNRDPEKHRANRRMHSSERRARKAKLPREHIDRRAVYERDRKRCGLCGKHVPWSQFSIDHIVPISRGGPHLLTNVQTAHLACNIRKGNKGVIQPRLDL